MAELRFAFVRKLIRLLVSRLAKFTSLLQLLIDFLKRENRYEGSFLVENYFLVLDTSNSQKGPSNIRRKIQE